MKRSKNNINEGILITILGMLGIYKVMESFPDAGPFLTQMLYTMYYIFIAIIIIGVNIIIEEIGKSIKK